MVSIIMQLMIAPHRIIFRHPENLRVTALEPKGSAKFYLFK